MAESSVRQRKTVAEKTVAPEVHLEPDWAFVFSPTDTALQKHVGQALATLSDRGFYVTVRRGVKESVVVLARAGSGLVVNSSNRTLGVSRHVPELDGVVDNFPVETQAAPHLLSARPLLSGDQLNEIERHYGGSAAALYEFLNHLQTSLVVPAVLGVATYFTVGRYSLLFSAFVLLWGVYFVAKWQNVHEPDSSALPVTQFTRRAGYRGTSPQVRETRKLLFNVVAAALLVLYALGLLAVLALEVFCTQFYDGPVKPAASLVPIGANIAASIVYGIVYNYVIDRFLEWEDYPSSEELQEVKAQRTFYLNVLLGFLPILLSAFVYLPFGNRLIGLTPSIRRSRLGRYVRLAPEFKLNTRRLLGQAIFYSVQNQIISLVLGAGLPSALYALKRYVLKQAEPADRDSFALQQLRPPFDVDTQLSNSVIAFGYILLLAPVWPLTALAGLIGIYVRTKGSLYMLTYGARKSVNRRGRTIGHWNRDLTFMLVLASLVAPAISVMFGRSTAVYSLTRSLVNVSGFAVVTVALVSENSVLVLLYIANNFFRLLRPSDTPTRRQTVRTGDTAEQDKVWRGVDVTADLRRVFPDAR